MLGGRIKKSGSMELLPPMIKNGNRYLLCIPLPPWCGRKEYGWYDCNKLNPTARPNGVPDGYMCWAATASNMLQWWIDQNKRYIDMYGDKYTGPDYTYPSGNKQESNIFQCFLDAFPNKAGKEMKVLIGSYME